MFKKILFVLALTFLFSALFSFTLPNSSQIVNATPPYTLIERTGNITDFPYTIQDGDGVIYTVFADTDNLNTHVRFQNGSSNNTCTRVIWDYPISATDGTTARMAEGEGVCQGSGSSDFENSVGDIAVNVTINGSPSDPSDLDLGGEAGTVANTCESLNPGLGWIACAIMAWSVNFLGELTVTTEGGGFLGSILNFSLEGNQEEAIRAVWSGFRVLANSLFVIMFLFVIYSAATGSVINAYDLKRLLPRLIFSAIAVQLSFFISLTLLSLFNDIGIGAGQLLLAPLPGEGTASAADSILVASPMTGLASFALPLVYLLLTIVVAGMAIVGVIMMAILFIVRNMGLVILIAISPIAFVLWTLPNTERIFKKWWEWFVQLLAVFPIAALFFASGKLIAYVWIGSTGGEDTDLGENEIGNVLIGTIALFAPYFLAPKLMTFAGSAMGSIVRGVNGMKEGVDRTRNSGVGKRIETNLGAKAASRLNRPDPGMMSRMMRQTTIGRRVMAEQLDRKRQQDEGDARAAQVLQRERTAGLSSTERQQANREIALNTSGNHTPAEQLSAMKQMLIDSDEAGFHEALTGGSIQPTTWSTFMDQHGKEVHEKFRHFSTGDYNREGHFEPNYDAVARGSEADMATFKPNAIMRAVHELQNVAGNAANSMEVRDQAEHDLRQLATTYLGANENPQIRANWPAGLRTDLERLATTTGAASTPPPPPPPTPPPGSSPPPPGSSTPPPGSPSSSSGNTPTVNINMNTPMQGSQQQQPPPASSGGGGRVQQEFGQPRTFRPTDAPGGRPEGVQPPLPFEEPERPPDNNQQQ